jgi:hypothetical protein
VAPGVERRGMVLDSIDGRLQVGLDDQQNLLEEELPGARCILGNEHLEPVRRQR